MTLYLISRILLMRAKKGATGKVQANRVMKPNWMTISRYSWKRKELLTGASLKSFMYCVAFFFSALILILFPKFNRFKAEKGCIVLDVMTNQSPPFQSRGT